MNLVMVHNSSTGYDQQVLSVVSKLFIQQSQELFFIFVSHSLKSSIF
jgi:hypothetical protein